jgi:hypothetical protein
LIRPRWMEEHVAVDLENLEGGPGFADSQDTEGS